MERDVLESPATTKEASPAAHLRAAVLAQRIYPAGSPMVERSALQAKIAAESILKTTPKITITDRQGRLYVNGKEDADAAALAGFMKDQGVQSLTFLPGLAADEIVSLVGLLCRKQGVGAKFPELLAAAKVSHIQADKVTVVEIEEGESVTKKVDSLFENVSDFSGMVGSLRDAYDLMDRAPSIAERSKIQDRMASRLASAPSHLIRDLFENPLPKRMEDENIREEVLKKMTTERVHDIFSEIGQWYENIRKNTSSDFEAVDRLNQLKGFLGKILGSPASRRVPFAVYEELLQKGLIEDIPEGVSRAPEEESLAARVDRMLEGDAAALLENKTREGLPAVFEKLCATELFDLAKSLMAKFLDNLYQESSLLRGMAVRTARNLLEVLWRSRCPDLGDHLHESLRRLADAERSRDTYGEVAGILAWVAVRFLLEDKPIHAMENISLLRRHKEDVFPAMPGRAEIAGRALEKSAGEAMDVLVEGLTSADIARAAATRNVLHALGGAAAPCLVETVKKAGDQRTRRCAALALKDMGETGAKALSTELTVGLSGPALLNLLSAAQDFPSSVLLPPLKGLAMFPDAFLRARVVQILGRLEEDDARELLVRMLGDRDENVRLEAVRHLGEARYKPAAMRLAELLREGGNVLRREETCIALGKIADESCVSALVEVLSPRGGIFSRSKEEETVRVRAVWALGNIKTSSARRGLKALLEDDNPQVRMIALQALES